jgi:hypothetical protein
MSEVPANETNEATPEKEKSPTPHDLYFRQIMSLPGFAAAEFQSVLPEAAAALVDWTAMEPQPTNFVTRRLRGRNSDLIFRTRIAGREGYICALIEHQSTPDPLMAFRIQEYVTAFWSHLVKRHKKSPIKPSACRWYLRWWSTAARKDVSGPCPWIWPTCSTSPSRHATPWASWCRAADISLDDITAEGLAALVERDVPRLCGYC